MTTAVLEDTEYSLVLRPASSGRFYYHETIPITASVTSTATTWTELANYTKTINFPKKAENVVVRFHFPYSGNQNGQKRSRARLQFDGADIAESAIYHNDDWGLRDIVLEGIIQHVAAGNHTVKIFTKVDGGTFQLPHFAVDIITSDTPIVVRFTIYN